MSWKVNPYDEPPETFDEWVAGIEAKIVNALHPPRQKLFPEPEPIRTVVLQQLARSVEQPAAAAVDDTHHDALDDDSLSYPTEPLGAEIRYPDLPVTITDDEAGKQRDVERDTAFTGGSKRGELDDEDEDESASEDDDAISSLESDQADVVLLSSSEDEDEREEATEAASGSEAEGEESSDEGEGADPDTLAEYDSDGHLVPRATKSLLDLEAAIADDASADDDDDAAARLPQDNYEDVDDMYEDDADVLPPLEEDDAALLSALPPNAGDTAMRMAQPTGFVSALSLPLSGPSSVPALSPPAAASPSAATPIDSATGTPEVEVFELSDSDDEDEADQLEDVAPPRSSRAETEDADQSMDEVADDGFSAAFQAYSEADEAEKDELAGSESGEEFDEDGDDGRAEFAGPHQDEADRVYLAQPASRSASPTPFEAYAQEQATYDHPVAPPGPMDSHMDSDELLDYSVHPPTTARLDGTYHLETFAPTEALAADDDTLEQTKQTFEVDPSLLALDEGFPPAPLDLPVLHAEAQLAADLVAITGGDLTFAAPLVELASDPELGVLSESGLVRDTPQSPVPSLSAGNVSISLPATIQSYLPRQDEVAPIEVESVDAPSEASAVANDSIDFSSAAALFTELRPETQEAAVDIYADVDVESQAILAAASEHDELDVSPMDAEDDEGDVRSPRVVPSAISDVGPVLPPSPEPAGDEESEATPFAGASGASPVDKAPSPAMTIEDEKDELEDSDGSSAVEVIGSSSSTDDGNDENGETASEAESEVDAVRSFAEEEEDLAPPAPVVPPQTRLPLPLLRKSTEQVAATHAQANPFAALTVEGLSSDDESGRGSDQDSVGEDDRDLTPVTQKLELPDAFELEHEQAMQPQYAVLHPATPSVADVRSSTPPAIPLVQNDVQPASSLHEPEPSEPLLPASPIPRSSSLATAPSSDEQMAHSVPPAPILSSPILPSTPPTAVMDVDAPPLESFTSGTRTPVDEFEAEHEAAMQPLPSAILDVEVEAAEEHTAGLTVAALHSLDEVEREHDAAIQPKPALVRDHIIHDEEETEASASASGSNKMSFGDDPVLPISTPLHEPGEVSMPGYVEPADEPNLPDARAEPEPTILITPAVPHVSEEEGSVMAEPADTRPTTPEVGYVPPQTAGFEAAPIGFTPSSLKLDRPPSPTFTITTDTYDSMDAPPAGVDQELGMSAVDDSYAGDNQHESLDDAGSDHDAVRPTKAPSVQPSTTPDKDEVAMTASSPNAAVPAALAGTSSGFSAAGTVVVEATSDEDGDKTDGGSEGEEVDEGSDDDDGLVLIESRRLSASSAPRPSPPTPPRVLPERFLAADVFSEAPEELPQPPQAETTGITEHSSDVRANSRTLSYHHHGSSFSSGPLTIPRTAVVAPHAGTPSPRKRMVSPARSIRASSPSRVASSPVTRSQCVYHVLDLPGPKTGRTRFAVPYCSLSDADAIRHEDAKICGVATPEENERRRPLTGEGAVDIDEALDKALTRIVGIDMVKEGHCFFLDRLPPATSPPRLTRSGDALPAESSDVVDEPGTSEAADMETDDAATSPRKRKRSEADKPVPPSQAATKGSDAGDDADKPLVAEQLEADEEQAGEESSSKRQRMSEEPTSAPAPSRRWSFWPFSR